MSAPVVVELPYALALTDLSRSGLNKKDFKNLHLEALSSDQTFALTGRFKARSLKIPYHDRTGQLTNFYRLRFLDDVRGFGARKALRYWQPADTAPCAYFPPTSDWSVVIADPSQEIWITEGEKKAAKACKEGIACIGLGGIWSWRSEKRRQPFITDLAEIDWKGRVVKICFDSEADQNPLVRGAEEALAHQLGRLGAKEVGLIRLPLLGDADKTGLDDYLVAEGVKALRLLKPDLPASGALLLELNDELAVIDTPSAILHLKTEQLFTKTQPLTQILYAHKRLDLLDKGGRLVETNAVTEWLRWPARRRHAGIAFEPGAAATLEDGRYNLWRGWPYAPKKGDLAPFMRLFDYLFSAVSPDLKRWFMQWLAYPIQHPGTKLYAACLLWSRATGTGKSLLGYTMGRLYGPSFAVVTEAELHGSFNSWQVGRQFVLGEEITGSDRKIEANRLKHLITGETVRVNRKFQPEYDVKNCLNFLFTSNYPDAFALDDEDRRYFVHDVGSALTHRPPEQWFTRTYNDWYKGDDAPAALMHHLLNVDLKGFDPYGKAPETVDRSDMISVSGTDADRLARDLRDAPDALLRVGEAQVPRDLFTLEELVELLDPTNKLRLSPQAFARALGRAGFKAPKELTRTARGRFRLWCVRNRDRWATASHPARAAHYDGAEGEPKRPKF